MPAIKEYRASPVRLEPSARGMAEWETTARRAGPLYNAAAQDVRERGKIAADDIESGGWMLNFLNLYHRIREDQEDEVAARRERSASARTGYTFGPTRSTGSAQFGAGYGMAGGRISPASYPGGGAISGGVGLSQIAAADAKKRHPGGKLYEPETYKDELQRDLAQDPWSYDDLTKRLTGESYDEYQQRQEMGRDIERMEGTPLQPGPAGVNTEFDKLMKGLAPDAAAEPTSSWWNPANWMPSFGSSPVAEAEIPR